MYSVLVRKCSTAPKPACLRFASLSQMPSALRKHAKRHFYNKNEGKNIDFTGIEHIYVLVQFHHNLSYG
jgi:hypothetical protein